MENTIYLEFIKEMGLEGTFKEFIEDYIKNNPMIERELIHE